MWLVRELWFHRRNHYLSILSTSVAFFLVLVVSVLSDSMINDITGRFASLGTDVTMLQVLDSEDDGWFSDLIREKGIKRHGVSCSDVWNDMDVVMCDNGLLTMFEFNIKEGRLFSSLDISYNGNCAVLGHEAYEKLGYPDIGETINIGGVCYRVCGILEKEIENLFLNVDNSIFIPIGYAESLNECSYYVADYSCYLEGYMTDMFGEDGFVMIDQSDAGKAMEQMLQLCRNVLMFLAYVAVFVSMIGLVSRMLSDIRERTYEIGIKKALGASNTQIFCQFLLEGMVVMTVSSLISVVLCGAVCLLLKDAGVISKNVNMIKNSSVLVRMCLFGLVCCMYPSQKGSRANVADALRRHE